MDSLEQAENIHNKYINLPKKKKFCVIKSFLELLLKSQIITRFDAWQQMHSVNILSFCLMLQAKLNDFDEEIKLLIYVTIYKTMLE